MEKNGGYFDKLKILKIGSKTGQNQFRIFPSKLLNSLCQNGSNGTPLEAVVSMLTSNHPLPSSRI